MIAISVFQGECNTMFVSCLLYTSLLDMVSLICDINKRSDNNLSVILIDDYFTKFYATWKTKYNNY